MRSKIVVVGSSNTDMVVKVPHIPVAGETVMGSDFMIIPGGKGANQAVSAARAGASVTFIACVSDDVFGKRSVENYKKEGIDVSRIKIHPGIHSGIAQINVSEDGENGISVAPGANLYLLPEDIWACEEVFENAKIVVAQLEVPIETVSAVAEIAYSKGIPFLLNPAPATVIPEDLFQKITILTPNETEASILTSKEKVKKSDIPEMAGELFSKGIKIVIVTMGKSGVYVKSDDFEGVIPGYRVPVVDTTAAGDVFNGVLASALAEGKALKEAIDFAQRAAAISVTRMGAQPSAPKLEEIRQYKFC